MTLHQNHSHSLSFTLSSFYIKLCFVKLLPVLKPKDSFSITEALLQLLHYQYRVLDYHFLLNFTVYEMSEKMAKNLHITTEFRIRENWEK